MSILLGVRENSIDSGSNIDIPIPWIVQDLTERFIGGNYILRVIHRRLSLPEAQKKSLEGFLNKLDNCYPLLKLFNKVNDLETMVLTGNELVAFMKETSVSVEASKYLSSWGVTSLQAIRTTLWFIMKIPRGSIPNISDWNQVWSYINDPVSLWKYRVPSPSIVSTIMDGFSHSNLNDPINIEGPIEWVYNTFKHVLMEYSAHYPVSVSDLLLEPSPNVEKSNLDNYSEYRCIGSIMGQDSNTSSEIKITNASAIKDHGVYTEEYAIIPQYFLSVCNW